MKNLTETLTTFISQITQMERDNTKLNEDIREIEKEKAEGYKTFNTETHILVEREKIEDVLSYLETLEDDCSSAVSDCDSAISYVEDARYGTEEVHNNSSHVLDKFKELLKEEEKIEFEKKAPAKKRV
mgnify:CR=1 FL=1